MIGFIAILVTKKTKQRRRGRWGIGNEAAKELFTVALYEWPLINGWSGYVGEWLKSSIHVVRSGKSRKNHAMVLR